MNRKKDEIVTDILWKLNTVPLSHCLFFFWLFLGVWVKKCSVFHKHVAERLAIKTGQRYEKIISTKRCKLSFLILKSALMWVRGSRSHNLKSLSTNLWLFRTWPGLSKTKINMLLHVILSLHSYSFKNIELYELYY